MTSTTAARRRKKAPADTPADLTHACGPVAVLDGYPPMGAHEWVRAWSPEADIIAATEVWDGEPVRLLTYWRGLDLGGTGCGYVSELVNGEQVTELGRWATRDEANGGHNSLRAALADRWAEYATTGAVTVTVDPDPVPA